MRSDDSSITPLIAVATLPAIKLRATLPSMTSVELATSIASMVTDAVLPVTLSEEALRRTEQRSVDSS